MQIMFMLYYLLTCQSPPGKEICSLVMVMCVGDDNDERKVLLALSLLIFIDFKKNDIFVSN